MTRFMKPGKHNFDYHDLSKIAIERALRDPGIKFEQPAPHIEETDQQRVGTD